MSTAETTVVFDGEEPKDNVTYLGPHERMTVDQAIAVAQTFPYQDVLICGYDDEGKFAVMSSHMSREQSLWLAEMLKKYILNELEGLKP